MDTLTSQQHGPVLEFGGGSLASKTPLPRAQEQSHLLHEPNSMISSIDPISGRDVMPMLGPPSLIDGILTIYFESEDVRTEFMNSPLTEPYHRLTGTASAEADRDG